MSPCRRTACPSADWTSSPDLPVMNISVSTGPGATALLALRRGCLTTPSLKPLGQASMREKYVILRSRALPQTIDAHGTCVPPVLFWHLALPRLPPARRAFFVRGITASRRSTTLEELNGSFSLGIASKPSRASCFHLSARAVIPNAARTTICLWKWSYEGKSAGDPSDIPICLRAARRRALLDGWPSTLAVDDHERLPRKDVSIPKESSHRNALCATSLRAIPC